MVRKPTKGLYCMFLLAIFGVDPAAQNLTKYETEVFTGIDTTNQ